MNKNSITSSRLRRWLPFLNWGQQLTPDNIKADLLAGLTGAILVLPQGVAYALIAGLPPQYGLYTAIVIPIIAALFGSSHHLISGPTVAISIVVMSVASQFAEIGTQQYIGVVLSITLLAGIMQFVMGLFRFGALINFIPHTVVIGFTAGAAIIIAASQLQHITGITVTAGISFAAALSVLISQLTQTDYYTLAVGLITLISAVAIRYLNPKWPHLLLGLFIGSLFNWLIDGAVHGVALVGALPGTLPPVSIPDLTPSTLQSLASGAIAIALLGLIEAVSIARAVAIRSQQRIDGNQEFIGQGLSNIIGSFFSCYPGSGSFTRTGANYDSGAKTPLAAIFSAIILAIIVISIPGITAYLPLPAMAGAILLIAWNLIDIHHIRQIFKTNPSESAVLLVTFMSTLLIELEFAIYLGVFLSLALYLRRTSRPTLMEVAPIPDHPRRQIKNVARYNLDQCPQLKILRIDGSIFFGAVDHVQQCLRQYSSEESGIKHILIIGKGINFIDVAGAEMFIQEANRLEAMGGKLMLSSLKGTVLDELRENGYLDKIGEHRFYDSPKAALEDIIKNLDENKCQTCPYRIFNECPPAPK